MACHSSVLSETNFPQLSLAGTRSTALVSCSSAVLSGGTCGAARGAALCGLPHTWWGAQGFLLTFWRP